MLNVVAIMGRLVADPIKKTTESGKEVAKFSLAVELTKDVTNFFDVKVFDNKAIDLIHKGDKVAIHGSLTQYKFQAKDGTNRSGVEIIANSIEFAEVARPNVESK